jgi:hypothetical protein
LKEEVDAQLCHLDWRPVVEKASGNKDYQLKGRNITKDPNFEAGK